MKTKAPEHQQEFKSFASNRNSAGSILDCASVDGAAVFLDLLLAHSSIIPSGVNVNAGDLVTSFGNDGVVMTDFAGGNDAANAVASTFRRKIVAAGLATMPTTQAPTSRSPRYDGPGQLDLSFRQLAAR